MKSDGKGNEQESNKRGVVEVYLADESTKQG